MADAAAHPEAARPSYAVGPSLTTTRRDPAPSATSTSEAAGRTVSVVPTARSRSQLAAAVTAAASTPRSSDCPKETVAVFRIPPQLRRAGPSRPPGPGRGRPVSARSARSRGHSTRWMLPCSSRTWRGSLPAKLVQAVDVLRDHRTQPAGTLEGDERGVAAVRAGGPGRVLGAAPPGLGSRTAGSLR